VHPVFHASQLRPAAGPHRQPAAIALDNQEEPEYEVEMLLDRRIVRGSP
jgi:hypothetical protein